jgi:signal transduction histidine kinase
VKLPPISLRTRLTLVYGGLFLLMGVVLEAITYVLMVHAIDVHVQVRQLGSPVMAGRVPGASVPRRPAAPPGDVLDQIERQRQAAVDQLIQGVALTLIAVVLLAVVLGYVVSGRMVRPLRQITATSRRLSGSNLHERIALTGPRDEIKELADTFDGMLDRLDSAFDSQRRFIANASHELRTPLAINRAVIDVAVSKPDACDTVVAMGGKLIATIDRHERLLDGLLLLARSERDLQDRRRPLDLAALTAHAVEQLGETARAAGVTIVPKLRPAPADGDAVLLERCATNLIENAVKYNVADGTVWGETGVTAGRAWLRVENTGPAVSPEQTEAIFEPFRRLWPDRVGSANGAGLGLSIVRAVAVTHDGSVRAVARPDGGLAVTLTLPAARPA